MTESDIASDVFADDALARDRVHSAEREGRAHDSEVAHRDQHGALAEVRLDDASARRRG